MKLVRNSFEEDAVCNDINEKINAIVHHLALSVIELDGQTNPDLIMSTLADIRELMDTVDMLLERKVSVAQVNKRKLLGSFDEFKLIEES